MDKTNTPSEKENQQNNYISPRVILALCILLFLIWAVVKLKEKENLQGSTSGDSGGTRNINSQSGLVVSVCDIIQQTKKQFVLVLGQDTTEIYRLHLICDALKNIGYTGIIVKEIPDLEIQSIEEKVNMLASLSRFVICDNSFTSGHIDELKICSSNRFTTAIIQEEGKGATWMQADYPVDFKFIHTFSYSDISKISAVTKQAAYWAEDWLNIRTGNLNSLYPWRKGVV